VVAQPLYLVLFPLGVIATGGLQTCNLICSSNRMCICALDLSNASIELCISLLRIHVILNRKAMYCIHSSLSVRPCVPTICWVVIVVIKLIKDLFIQLWLVVYSRSVTR